MAAVLKEDNKIATVQTLLKEWVWYRRGWAPDNGYPHAVTWIDQVKGHFDSWTEGEDYDLRIQAVQMRHVDEAVKSLSAEFQHAIAVVYLNEAGPAVWRSNRKPMREIHQICCQAELALVPLLRRRDVI